MTNTLFYACLKAVGSDLSLIYRTKPKYKNKTKIK